MFKEMLSESFTVELDKQPNPEPHFAIDLKEEEEEEQVFPLSSESPPPFAPYQPEFYYNSHGDLISHDHHLNEDGEALYRFILAQAAKPPTYLLHVLGTHKETRTRTIRTQNEDGTTNYRTQRETVTITDFSFYIDCSAYIVCGPIFWSYPDEVAAYRGLMVRQVDGKGMARRKATKQEKRTFESEECLADNEGLPPWHGNSASRYVGPEASSKSPREWADEYAASPKLLKEFVYRKTIHGWNPTALSQAIEAAVSSTSYSGRVDATFRLSRDKIYIRPDNRLSRTLSRRLYKVLLWITLVYPFIWLFKRFGKQGGGRWEVVGAAYGLKHVEVLGNQDAEMTHEEETGNKKGGISDVPQDVGNTDTSRMVHAEGSIPIHEQRIVQDELGRRVRITGHREGEWFKEWEPVIKRCAAMRLQSTSDEALKGVADGPCDPREALEGY